MGAFQARLQERLGFVYDEDAELDCEEDYPPDFLDPADFEVADGDIIDGERDE